MNMRTVFMANPAYEADVALSGGAEAAAQALLCILVFHFSFTALSSIFGESVWRKRLGDHVSDHVSWQA